MYFFGFVENLISITSFRSMSWVNFIVYYFCFVLLICWVHVIYALFFILWYTIHFMVYFCIVSVLCLIFALKLFLPWLFFLFFALCSFCSVLFWYRVISVLFYFDGGCSPAPDSYLLTVAGEATAKSWTSNNMCM